MSRGDRHRSVLGSLYIPKTSSKTNRQGCIWVSAAADFGPEGVLERCLDHHFFIRYYLLPNSPNTFSPGNRFEQVRPSLVFSVDAVVSVFDTAQLPCSRAHLSSSAITRGSILTFRSSRPSWLVSPNGHLSTQRLLLSGILAHHPRRCLAARIGIRNGRTLRVPFH